MDYRSNFLDGGYLCIFMAYCEGGDLATQISLARDAQRRIAEAQLLRWVTQAGEIKQQGCTTEKSHQWTRMPAAR